MRSTATLSRSVGKSLSSHSQSHICRTCLAQAQPLQRRQIQSSAPQRAGFLDKLAGRFLGKQPEPTTAVTPTPSSPSLSSTDAVVLTKAQREEAKTAADDPGYFEAQTWDGLERVGSAAWIEDQLDPHDSYKGWATLNRDVVLEEKEAGSILFAAASDIIAKAKKTTQERSSWLDIRLTSPKQKFTIAKKLQEEAGIRLSDFALNSCGTLRDLRSQMIVKPKPKKLAPVIEEVVAGLPNVRVHASRVTSIDKETAVGRWKVIEQALIDQGLPVTGHRGKEEANL